MDHARIHTGPSHLEREQKGRLYPSESSSYLHHTPLVDNCQRYPRYSRQSSADILKNVIRKEREPFNKKRSLIPMLSSHSEVIEISFAILCIARPCRGYVNRYHVTVCIFHVNEYHVLLLLSKLFVCKNKRTKTNSYC